MPPVSLNGARERMLPKTSVLSRDSSLPVLVSVRRSSRRAPPRATQISCARVPENWPTHAAVIALDCSSE